MFYNSIYRVSNNLIYFFTYFIMQKQIKKIDDSLKKVSDWITKCIYWEYRQNLLILNLLYKREKLLEKTKRKLIKLNLNNFLTWEESQNTIIS